MSKRFDPYTEPWERQPREPDRAYAAFLKYRDMGPARSAAKVAEIIGVSRKAVNCMMKPRRWTERVRLWDNHVDRESQAAMLAAGRAAAVKHASLAGSSMAVLAPVIMALDKRSKSGTLAHDLDKMSARDLLRLAQLNAPALKALVEIERISHGLPSNHVGLSGPDGGAVKVVSTAELLLDVFSERGGIVDGGSERDESAAPTGAPRPDAEE